MGDGDDYEFAVTVCPPPQLDIKRMVMVDAGGGGEKDFLKAEHEVRVKPKPLEAIQRHAFRGPTTAFLAFVFKIE